MARANARRKAVRAVRKPLTGLQKAGIGSAATLIAVAGLGLIAGVVLDRLLNFDDAFDAGGEWDEGGGVFTRWD
ncbi:hypothetical protein IWC96_13765 [Brevundimonas sp. BAL450]|jgi:hypothetical protein|uniref:Uncharacterized protein n=1 Tax=Brevundimonas abyssalis TAR-001 TaxID=1391729 RepID=A0A8E0NAN5_9CAUL|nr:MULTISPECIES: hypothetical protein [Brevundimonas]MBG7616340.1 hypothetical protein [Brevundimonas sp. BAL450]GAD58303.1 hypothetical protein MBEBAB_0553 [Brevundimonas abyssalis TAR-001]